jgi:hypothetical protein
MSSTGSQAWLQSHTYSLGRAYVLLTHDSAARYFTTTSTANRYLSEGPCSHIFHGLALVSSPSSCSSMGLLCLLRATGTQEISFRPTLESRKIFLLFSLLKDLKKKLIWRFRLFAALFIGCKVAKKTKMVPISEIDIYTGRVTEEEGEIAPQNKNRVQKIFSKLL